ncbi:MAG: nitrate reductase molybdenum cofactor assembly chaperone, partial [Polaromonas sp.]|nr:nitrate reductase molybdenum cofactor assembly chaperone [Polaromonas sp.]
AHAVKVVPDEELDAAWEEPVVFDGCSSKGQAKPNQPQPIHIVRNEAARAQPTSAMPQGATP